MFVVLKAATIGGLISASLATFAQKARSDIDGGSVQATCVGASASGSGLFLSSIRQILIDPSTESIRQKHGLQTIQPSDVVIATDSVICRRVRSLDLAVVQSNNGGQPPDSVFGRTFIVARAGPYWAYRMHRSADDPFLTGISIANDSLTRVIVAFR